MVGQVVQELLDQGETEGLAKGLAKGLAQGLAQGRAEDLTWLLEHRFGPLPAAARKRLAGASPDELQSWFKAALGASSLAAAFNGHGLD